MKGVIGRLARLRNPRRARRQRRYFRRHAINVCGPERLRRTNQIVHGSASSVTQQFMHGRFREQREVESVEPVVKKSDIEPQ